MKIRSLLALSLFCLPTCQSDGELEVAEEAPDQDQVQESPRGTSVISSALLGSCSPSDCGGESSSGDGWCDNTCANWGDCAEDAGDVCGFDECIDDQSCDRNQTCADAGGFLECKDVVVAPRAACDDRIDNDGDGRVDYPEDPGCTSPFDNDEAEPANTVVPACSDGIDNDGDGLADFPEDPGCGNRFDPIEEDPPTSTPFSSLCAPLAPGTVEITEKVTYGTVNLANPSESIRYVLAVPHRFPQTQRIVEADYPLWQTDFPDRDWQGPFYIGFDDSRPHLKFKQETSYADWAYPAGCYEVDVENFSHPDGFDYFWSGDSSNYNFPTDIASFRLELDITADFRARCTGYSIDDFANSELFEDCNCVNDVCLLDFEIGSCANGIDDDGDGFTDFPEDPGCDGVGDDDESNNPECSDGIDNDGDGQIDAGDDSDCDDIYDDSEFTPTQFECEDGIDNDGDGRVDLDDSDCRSVFDNSESQ